MLRQMIYRLVDAVLPRPPVLKTALAERHVYTGWIGHELVYMVASACPVPDEVQPILRRRQRRLQCLVTVCELLFVVFTLAAFIAIGSVVTRIFTVS